LKRYNYDKHARNGKIGDKKLEEVAITICVFDPNCDNIF